MRKHWENVRAEHVLEAINLFERSRKKKPLAARNTFLLYEGKMYLAQHARGMAYEK
ncbi:MAG: hypothetical protein NZM41_07940 [Saprospiraceae bacterium]|nr:hypothetical protein [Saprospiraceae bacterium]